MEWRDGWVKTTYHPTENSRAGNSLKVNVYMLQRPDHSFLMLRVVLIRERNLALLLTMRVHASDYSPTGKVGSCGFLKDCAGFDLSGYLVVGAFSLEQSGPIFK